MQRAHQRAVISTVERACCAVRGDTRVARLGCDIAWALSESGGSSYCENSHSELGGGHNWSGREDDGAALSITHRRVN